MDVLLLSGYRPSDAVGLSESDNGELLMDARITSLMDLGLSPIVILSGDHADDHLRQSRRLEQCELVFDTNGSDANLFSNTRAGLYATEEACFVLPVEIPPPPETIWKNLKQELINTGFSTDQHVFHMTVAEGAPWHFGFPLLISSYGRKVFLELENSQGLTDPRLRYRSIA